MRVWVKGSNSKLSEPELRHATRWMCEHIMPPEVTKKLHITLISEYMPKDRGATCPIRYGQLLRSFEVTLDPTLSKRVQLRTLAHEIVHVKQYAMGEMRDRFTEVRQHRKVLYRLKSVRWRDDVIDPETVEYMRQPWEIEARKKEYGLYRRYCDHLVDHPLQKDR